MAGAVTWTGNGARRGNDDGERAPFDQIARGATREVRERDLERDRWLGYDAAVSTQQHPNAGDDAAGLAGGASDAIASTSSTPPSAASTSSAPSPARRSRLRRWLRRGAVAAALTLAAFVALVEVYGARDATRALLAGREALGSSSTARVPADDRAERAADALLVDAELVGDGDLVVRVRLRLPPGDGPHPVVVVMGGQRTGRRVVDLVEPTRPVALLGLDYPYTKPDPKPKGLGPNAREGLVIHAAVWDVVPAAMLAFDWIETRDDLDASRIALVGGSLGALFAPAIAAHDERVAAVGLLLGAGDLGGLVAANLKAPWPLPHLAGWLASSLVAPLEPLDHIAAIAPRPVLFVAGEGDERMPRALSEKLIERCGDPKEVRWLDLGHVNVRDPEFHTQVLGEVVAWFDRVGVLGE